MKNISSPRKRSNGESNVQNKGKKIAIEIFDSNHQALTMLLKKPSPPQQKKTLLRRPLTAKEKEEEEEE